MITSKKNIIALLFVATLLILAGTGCATAHGFGQDMQQAGGWITNDAKK